VADTKLVKLAGEHWVCSVMARHGWGAALTRDGLEHADVLAVHSSTRRLVEVQVKTASFRPKPNWRLNLKAQEPSKSDHEWFVLVALGQSPSEGTNGFVVPRDHVSAAAWITHENWRTEPGVEPGKRNAGVDQAIVQAAVFAGYRERWDLLHEPTPEIPVLLPVRYRDLALSDRVGLPPVHPWRDNMPDWSHAPNDAP
jgi:hypothetical protein